MKTERRATVICMDWFSYTDGSLYKGFHGIVTVAAAEEVVGFVPTGHNSANWFATVKGTETTVHLMGCQVRAIVEEPPPTHRDYLIVP